MISILPSGHAPATAPSRPSIKLVEPVKAAGELESFKTLAELEREYLEKVLVATEGNKSQTAKILGITVKTLYNKLHDCGLFAKYSRK